MIRREGDRLMIGGAVTLANVTGVLSRGLDEVRGGATQVDLAEITDLDSSLLAALLALIREARKAGHSLTLTNPPKGLTTLAQLYGVEALIPTA